MNLREFLQTVVTGPEEGGWFCLATSSPSTSWVEEWYQWPNDLNAIEQRVESVKSTRNVYFSSYLFEERSSLKENVLPTRTIQADLDEADPQQIGIPPTVLVQTSPGRHQAYWVLTDGPLDLDTHEVLSRKLTYAISRCDRSGWPLGRKVRVPGTLNFKYLDGPKPIETVSTTGKLRPSSDFELLPDVSRAVSEPYDSGFLDSPPVLQTQPLELLTKYRDKIGKSYVQYSHRQPDRSAALWGLTCALFRAGATREDAFWLAKHSANNKFSDLRHNGDRELAKDVLRAEQVVRSAQMDPRALIAQARRLGGPVSERRQMMYEIVIQSLKERGDFIRTYGEYPYYIQRDVGRPVMVTRHSEYLSMLLDIQYGLNDVEVDSNYVRASICAYSQSLPQNGVAAALSYFDKDLNVMLIHTGRKDVMRITANSIERVSNGSYGVVFPWDNSCEPFAPAYTDDDWGESMFGRVMPGVDGLANIVGLDRDQAMAMLKVWMIFLLMREAASSKPILVTLGQPGGGKTMLFKKIYRVLYGKYRSISSVTTPDDFDHGVATDAFYALDNVDTWEKWLPDRVALSAAVSDIRKRKLYTDADIITVRRQALVGISAHNPKFGREDVADRMLIFTFQRLQYFHSDVDIVDTVYAKRNEIWGGIVRDIQRVLASPKPNSSEVPQFRIEDFAKLGFWIARAIGCADAFSSGILRAKTGQRNFTLEDDYVLVSAIRKYVEKVESAGEPHTPGQLWGQLALYSDDRQSFERMYRNSVALGKKLWSMNDALKEIFDLRWEVDSTRASRVWSFRLKERRNGTIEGSGSDGVVGADVARSAE